MLDSEGKRVDIIENGSGNSRRKLLCQVGWHVERGR